MSKRLRVGLTIVSLTCTILLGPITNFASEELRDVLRPIQGQFGWLFLFVSFLLIVSTIWDIWLDRGDGSKEADEISQTAQDDRRYMLNHMKLTWIRTFVDFGLAKVTKLHLRLRQDPEAVIFRLRTQVLEINHEPRMLPPNTSIRKVFEDFGESLLILGTPGSGKTTLLAELARSLITVAEKNSNYPIPIIFSLSSWATKRNRLEEWLIEELHETYDVPPHVARYWINNDLVLPLLDGLDEVAESCRNNCVEAINDFKQSRKKRVRIVVTSRVDDYTLLTQNLQLQGAVIVQPLTKNQVDKYLDGIDEDISGLRIALREDEQLQELAKTPLMLNIMTLAYKGKPSSTLLQIGSEENRRAQIFDEYITTMFHRRAVSRNYKQDDTISWLSWLAQQMSAHDAIDLLIEKMQPSWLPSQFWLLVYVYVSRIISSFLLAAALTSTVFAVTSLELFLMGLISGIIIGFIDSLRLTKKRAAGFLNNTPKWTQILIVWAAVGLGLGILFGLTKEAPLQDKLIGNTIAITGLSLGLLAATFYGVLFGLRGSKQTLQKDVQPVEKLQWSSNEAISGAINYSTGFGIIFALIASTIWFTGGRGSEWVIAASNEVFGWLYSLLGVSEGLPRVACFALLLGLLFGGLLGSTIEGFKYGIIDREKTRLNEGMQLSIRNAIFAVGVFGTIFSVLFFLPFGMFYHSKGESFSIIIINSIKNGLVIGIIAALWNGGFDIIQHYTLRVILYVNGYLPEGSYTKFLNYATERAFLSRVGGGYRFVHLTLRDHFTTKEHKPVSHQKWSRISFDIGKIFIPILIFIYLFNVLKPNIMFLWHQKPLSTDAEVYFLEVGDDIQEESGLRFDDIQINSNDKVIIQVVVLNELNMVSCDRDLWLEEDHDRHSVSALWIAQDSEKWAYGQRTTEVPLHHMQLLWHLGYEGPRAGTAPCHR